MGLADRRGRRAAPGAGRRNSFVGASGTGRACRERRSRGLHRKRPTRLRQSHHHQTRRQFVVRLRPQSRNAGARWPRSRVRPSDWAHGRGRSPSADSIFRDPAERPADRPVAFPPAGEVVSIMYSYLADLCNLYTPLNIIPACLRALISYVLLCADQESPFAGRCRLTEGQRDKKQEDQEEEQSFSMPNDCIPVSALPFYLPSVTPSVTPPRGVARPPAR
jgi:hypothetical protein